MKRILTAVRKRPHVAAIITIIALIVLFFALRNGKRTPPLLTVSRETVVQEVNVTGKLVPVTSLELSFERSGKVSRSRVRVGDRVREEDILAELELQTLAAELKEAEASVAREEAKLAELTRGARPEDITVKETELEQERQDLANDYASVSDTVNDAYLKTDDAVRKQADELFVNDEEPSPQLTFTVTDSQREIDVEFKRLEMTGTLNAWKRELDALRAVSPTAVASRPAFDQALAKSREHLLLARDFLDKAMAAVLSAASLPQVTISAYKANLTTARTNVNAALSSVNDHLQTLAAERLSVKKIEDELRLKLAGTPVEQIAAQAAALEEARAHLDLIYAELDQSVIRAPLAGIVTRQDAKPGEIVVANTPLVSLISDEGLKIEADIPEIDIGKVAAGNPVRIAVDALPGETFRGTVAYVDPAETVIDGVVNFKTTVHLDLPDPRLKSGLTANLTIETLRKEDVLAVPQFGLLETESGTRVKKLEDGTIVEVLVTVGIRGAGGLVEIVSGLHEGDRIVNVAVRETTD